MVTEMGTDEIASLDKIRELEQALAALREDSEVAHVLLGLAGVLAELRSVEQTLETAVRVVPGIMGADRCFALTRIGGAGRFYIQAHSGASDDEVKVLEDLAGRENGLPLVVEALETKGPVLVGDAAADGRIPDIDVRRTGVGALIAMPLVRWGERFGGLLLEYRQPREFGSKDLALARGVARQVGQSLVNARRFNLLGGLRDLQQRLAPKLSLPGVIDEVTRGAVDLFSADAAALYFLDAANSVLVAASASVGDLPDGGHAVRRFDVTSEPWDALLEGSAIAVKDLVGEGEGSWDAVAVPLSDERGGLQGAIAIFFKRDVFLAPDETEALRVFAGHAAVALQNAQTFERQRRMSRSLQQGLLVTGIPAIPGCEIGSVYDAASGEADIGGDFYDVFDLPDGRYAMVVGDVSGKGAEAAARTAMAKYMLRAFAIRNPAPSSVLYHLNNALTHDLEDERFATVLYGVLDPQRRRVTFGSGGHPPPIIYRHSERGFETVELPGAIIGAFDEQQYQQETYTLEPGDVIVAFTDGLIEARSATGELHGRRRIEKSLCDYAGTMPPQPMVERLLEDAKAFGELTDDTVVFAVRIQGG